MGFNDPVEGFQKAFQAQISNITSWAISDILQPMHCISCFGAAVSFFRIIVKEFSEGRWKLQKIALSFQIARLHCTGQTPSFTQEGGRSAKKFCLKVLTNSAEI